MTVPAEFDALTVDFCGDDILMLSTTKGPRGRHADSEVRAELLDWFAKHGEHGQGMKVPIPNVIVRRVEARQIMYIGYPNDHPRFVRDFTGENVIASELKFIQLEAAPLPWPTPVRRASRYKFRTRDE